MAALQAALAKFRSQAVAASNTLDQGRKEREDKLQKKQADAKPTGRKPAVKVTRPKAKASAATSAASDGPSASAPGDWKNALPAREMEPLGLRQMKVIDFLKEAERPMTVASILKGTQRDLSMESDLAASLALHPRVVVTEDGLYEYQAAVRVKDRTALLDYIRRSQEPVALSEVSDAYMAVKQDVEALKKEGLVLVLHSHDLGEEVLFPVDMRLEGVPHLEQSLWDLWHKQLLPDDDEDMAAELRKAGIRPAPRKAPRKKGPNERKKKARKQVKMRHVTNVHMMDTGIFDGDAPTQID